MKTEEHILESPNKHKDFVVSGSLVSIRDRPNKPAAAQAEATPRAKGRVLTAGEILTIEEVAAKSIDGLDTAKILNAMGDIGPEARLFIYRPNGKLARYKINVNVVCPGLTETPLLQAVRSQSEQTGRIIEAVTKATPFRRPAQPEEIAEAVLFFASPAADFITGQTLSVSGGLTMV